MKSVVHYRGHEYPCLALNLSRSGVLLKGGIPWPSEETVDFSLEMPHQDEKLELTGRVAWIREDETGTGTCLALEFADLDAHRRETIEQLVSRVIEGQAPAGIESIKPGTPPQEIRKALESVPLAHRIALAARSGPRERGYLRHDPHPQVLESLVRNPNLLAAEARDIAKVAHVLPSTLQILATDARWAGDLELRVIVATHPRIALPLAERLCASMNVAALRKVIARPGLNPGLRTKLNRRIAKGK